MPGSSVASTRSTSARDAITACGAHATPPLTNAAFGETVERRGIEIVGAQVLVRDEPGRARRIGIEHDRAIAQALRRVDEHAAELAAAENPERRAGGDERRHAHLSSALIARAASLWRWRYASSCARSFRSPLASIATANSAALAAPAAPIANVATGTPLGICTIE